MKNSFLSTSMTLFALSMATTFANDKAQVKNLENRVTALEQRKGSNGIILPPAGPVLDNDYGIALDVEFLYLKSNVKGISPGQEISISGAPHEEGDSILLDWQLNPGARAFIAYRPTHDNWEVRATWMYLYSKASVNQTAPSGFYISSNFPPEPSYFPEGTTYPNQISGHWRMNFNQIDLDLSRNSYLSKWLALRFVGGLRTAWLFQDLNYSLSGGSIPNTGSFISYTRMSNDFWGMGPRIALDTRWGLGQGFSIFVNGGASLLWGFFKTNTYGYATTTGQSTSFAQARMLVHTDIAVFDLDVGLSYDTSFYDDQFHFGFKAGWEHHLYSETSMFGGSDTPQGSTTTEGLMLSARFDF